MDDPFDWTHFGTFIRPLRPTRIEDEEWRPSINLGWYLCLVETRFYDEIESDVPKKTIWYGEELRSERACAQKSYYIH